MSDAPSGHLGHECNLRHLDNAGSLRTQRAKQQARYNDKLDLIRPWQAQQHCLNKEQTDSANLYAESGLLTPHKYA